MAKREITWSDGVGLLKEALEGDGAFLVVLDKNGRPNPMTIGWAEVGIVWSRPVCTVLVRPSRYTHGGIRASGSFTVNVPRPGELKEALLFCGTKSGRDLDKAKASFLTLAPGRRVKTPVIDECALHYECEILARVKLREGDFASAAVLEESYPKGDHHLIVLGEIVAAYAEENL